MSSKLKPSQLKVAGADTKEAPSLSASTHPTSALSCVVIKTDTLPREQNKQFYLPLFYSEKIKNPGKSHFVKRVLLSHWAFAVIAWSCITPHPLINALSLLLLTLSYWCVYEIGYQENDDIASQCEQFPTLSSTYRQYRSQINLYTAWPWIWAAVLAVPGCLLFSLSQQTANVLALSEMLKLSAVRSTLSSTSMGQDMLHFLPSWMAFLVLVRLTFSLYNRVNETTRIWVYPLLQIQQLFGFALLAGTNAIGTVLLLSLTFSRWIKYCIYRCGGDRTHFPTNISCVLIFTMLFTALCLGSPHSADWITGQAMLAFAYCCLRSIKKMIKLKSSMGWLNQSSASPHSLYKGV